MIREPLSRRNLLSLRAAIKGFSAESVNLRKQKAKQKKSLSKAMLSLDRCYLGWNIRYHHLAHGFLKGLDYKQIEKKSAKKFTINDYKKILDVLNLFSPWVSLYLKTEDIRDWVENGKRFFLTKEEMTAKIEARNSKRKEGQRQC